MKRGSGTKNEKENMIMALFGKKKEKQKPSCCCASCDGNSMAKAQDAKNGGARIKILGTGCAKCNALEAATKEALERLGMNDAVDHVTDFSQIAAYGVMSTPALVVDGRVVSFGRVLKTEEVVKLLQSISTEQK